MNYNKIGEFISNERKNKKLTQAKLAEQLFVSEKTVSKWENGKGIPDTTTLPKLCEIFNVSINELLNGCKIANEEYRQRAEEELLNLQKERENLNKLFLKIEIAFAVLTLLSLFASITFAIIIAEKFRAVVIPIIIIALSFVLSIISFCFCLKIEQKAGYYVCKHCGHKHIPSYKQVNRAMHIGFSRYMKCPKCNKKSWQRKVMK